MSATNLNIRTDSEIKNAAEKIFEELGLNMSSAVNIFLRQTIREKGIPFALTLNLPNTETVEAIKEGRKIAYDKSVKGYKSIEELKKALDL